MWRIYPLSLPIMAVAYLLEFNWTEIKGALEISVNANFSLIALKANVPPSLQSPTKPHPLNPHTLKEQTVLPILQFCS